MLHCLINHVAGRSIYVPFNFSRSVVQVDPAHLYCHRPLTPKDATEPLHTGTTTTSPLLGSLWTTVPPPLSECSNSTPGQRKTKRVPR